MYNLFITCNLVATNDKTIQEFLKPHTPVVEENHEETVIDRKSQGKQLRNTLTPQTSQRKYSADDSAVPISQVSSLNDRLFEGNNIYVFVNV